jgi:hypothetical protein
LRKDGRAFPTHGGYVVTVNSSVDQDGRVVHPRALDDVSTPKPSALVLLVSRQRRQRYEWAVQAHTNAVATAEYEAGNTTRRLREICDDEAPARIERIKEIIGWTDNWLTRAQHEYNASAFGPFWDAVESAANNLGAIQREYDVLRSNVLTYHSMLEGRQHTFGPFPIDINDVPRTDVQIARLMQIVRMGQTNFYFANIWEHRQTRAVLIAGFHTLGQAIGGLAGVINHSVGSLQEGLENGLKQITSEQRRLREEHGEMLDNIQRRRKP